MELIPQIANAPIWLLAVLLVLVIAAITIALITRREVRLWPPSIGPTIETADLEEEIRRLQMRLTEEIEQTRKGLRDEIAWLRNRLRVVESDRAKLQEDLAATWRPLGSDQYIGGLLALFDRQAMRVPAHEEIFADMLLSLRGLRVELQQSGVSTVKNPILRQLFLKILQDLEWVERTVITLAHVVGAGLISAPMTSYSLREFGQAPSPPSGELKDTERLIETMLERAWRVTRERQVSLAQMVSTCTGIWFFASIDRTRMNILSEVAILRRLLEENY